MWEENLFIYSSIRITATFTTEACGGTLKIRGRVVL